MSSVAAAITATPAVDQLVSHDGKDYTTIKEGLAHILIPASASKDPQTAPRGNIRPQSVFYNPIQQFNRDISVLAIKAYGDEVIERKKISLEKRTQDFNKKKERKRKREEDGVSNSARKAGKIDSSNPWPDDHVAVVQASTEVSHVAPSEEQSDIGEVGVGQSAANDQFAAEGRDMHVEEDAQSEEAKSTIVGDRTTVKQVPKQPPLPKQPSFTILDALSATGLRALRYAQEIPFSTSITANDLLPAATKSINLNVEHNKLDHKIKVVTGNAVAHMYALSGEDCKDDNGRPKLSKKYDVIDLDPYGTAAPFLDAAVQAVRDDGGLLCVTCTDAGVWASNGYPEKAYSLYGGIPIKGLHSHEGGLRLILHSIAKSAARYGFAIEPLLSLSIDFYARVFVRIHKSPADVKFLAGKTMVVYNCDTGCGAWTTQMLARNKLAKNKNGNGHFWKHSFELAPNVDGKCPHCGTKTHLAGPMYAGPLQSAEFIKKILDGLSSESKNTYQTLDRIEGMLTVALEESLPSLEDLSDSPTSSSKTGKYDPAAIDHYPFFFLPSALSRTIHCITPHENAFRGALRHLGYRATRSHTKPGTIKTDAPWEIIWEVMREWVRQKAPVKEGAVKEGTAGWNIMHKGKVAANGTTKSEEVGDGENANEGNGKLEVVFDEALGKEKDGKKLVRYQPNPRENWGPMNRAKGNS